VTGAAERFGSGTALVTGGGAGIGEGFVRHLASLGMTVILADVDKGRAESVVADVVAASGRAEAYQVDVTDANAVDRMAAWAFERFGSVELLVNNAGIESSGRLWEIPVDRWRQVMAINVDGIFHCVRSFVPRMIEAGRPAVVANLSSVGGVRTVPFQTPYIVSKHAVLALTECLHQELRLAGAPVEVCAVLPHSVRSRIFQDAQGAGGDPLSDRFFAWMQQSNVESGLDPMEAAAHMVEQIAAGKFWVFSDDERGAQALRSRADLLLAREAPADPLVAFPVLAEE
jgi:NAD(P)-dependent dehydrogenase (short-subunit alcohol dehydrogenase family)